MLKDQVQEFKKALKKYEMDESKLKKSLDRDSSNCTKQCAKLSEKTMEDCFEMLDRYFMSQKQKKTPVNTQFSQPRFALTAPIGFMNSNNQNKFTTQRDYAGGGGYAFGATNSQNKSQRMDTTSRYLSDGVDNRQMATNQNRVSYDDFYDEEMDSTVLNSTVDDFYDDDIPETDFESPSSRQVEQSNSQKKFSASREYAGGADGKSGDTNKPLNSQRKFTTSQYVPGGNNQPRQYLI